MYSSTDSRKAEWAKNSLVRDNLPTISGHSMPTSTQSKCPSAKDSTYRHALALNSSFRNHPKDSYHWCDIKKKSSMFHVCILVSEVGATQAAKSLDIEIALVWLPKQLKSLSSPLFSLILSTGPEIKQTSRLWIKACLRTLTLWLWDPVGSPEATFPLKKAETPSAC